MTRRVTLIIDDPSAPDGEVERYEFTGGGGHVLPLVFRTMQAAVAAHAAEASLLTAAVKVVGEAIAAAAASVDEGPPR